MRFPRHWAIADVTFFSVTNCTLRPGELLGGQSSPLRCPTVSIKALAVGAIDLDVTSRAIA